MAELQPLKYGKVVGRFLANIADGPDLADLPDVLVATGRVGPALEDAGVDEAVQPLARRGGVDAQEAGRKLEGPRPETRHFLQRRAVAEQVAAHRLEQPLGGDQTQRQVEVAPDMFVADTLPGSEVFLRLRTGDGRIDGQPAAGNTGTGLLMGFGVTDSTAWDGGTYTLSFGAGDTYQVTDAGGTVVTTGTYAKGESIAFAGVQMRIEGQPANGDSFTLGPAGSRDIFATVQGLITTLDTNPTTDAQRAAMQNDLQAAMRDVATAQSKMIDARASGGAQLSAIDDAAALREANNVTLQGTLSTLRDLDWAEAIGRYQMENTALQAAQTVFMQMQSLSLFKLMG